MTYIDFDKPDGLCKRKRYQVLIQKASMNTEYNVPGRKGVVYNYLEDAYIPLDKYDFVITGTKGELWAIRKMNIEAYDTENLEIDLIPQPIWTKSSDDLFEYKQIPFPTQAKIKTGAGTILTINSEKSLHGTGDYILKSIVRNDLKVVNGLIFSDTYSVVT